ncbi:MAG: hypothetical protein ABSG28_09845 [Methanoregula sp.]|jgi:hypothetical protein|uniref:hypothetical protein n=1 Tax=Methanoregula sp. TaxID=2052170 RepID=UPI003C1AC5BC
MKDDATKTTGRDGNACTPQSYRLICIHNPGKETGRRIKKTSALAVIPGGEPKAGGVMPGPEPPVSDGKAAPAVPQRPDNNPSGTQSGSGDLSTIVPGKSGDRKSGISGGPGDPRAEIPVETGSTLPLVPAGDEHGSTGQRSSGIPGGGSS